MLKMVKNLLNKITLLPTSPLVTKFIGEYFCYKGQGQRYSDYNLSRIKWVLIIRLDQIGDVVMTTPFLRELRRNLPNAWITLVVTPVVLDLVENCPYVNEALACNWKGDRDIHRFKRHWRAWRFAKKYLQQRHFDLAILPRRDTDQSHGAILAYFSGAHHRVGYSDNNYNEKPPYYRNNDCLLTHVLGDNTIKHELESNLELLRFMGGNIHNDRMEIWLREEDDRFAGLMLKLHDIKSNELLIGFVPGAAHLKRMWPLANFVSLGTWLKEKYHAKIVVLGSQEEKSLGQQLMQKLKGAVVNTVGNTTLCQAAAILKRCYLYIGNDSGLMHLAAAAAVPVVEISCHPQNGLSSHQNSPKRFGPWGVPHRILQPEKATAPCSESCIAHEDEAHCVRRVTVDQVKKAVAELLSNHDQKNENL